MCKLGKSWCLCVVAVAMAVLWSSALMEAGELDLPAKSRDIGESKNLRRAETDLEVLAAFERLAEHIEGLPLDLLNRGRARSFLAKVENAEAAYRRENPCTAANILGAYLNSTRGLRKRHTTEVAEDLYNRGRTLLHLLLERLPDGLTCPGLKYSSFEPMVEVAESDNKVFRATVSFGTPRMWSVLGEGELFTQLEVPGVALGNGEIGHPAVPVFRSLIAVPRGAEASIEGRPLIGETIFLNLYPTQPQPEDEDGLPGGIPIEEPDPSEFDDKPFEKNDDAYTTDAFFPGDVCSTTHVGFMRSVQLAEVACATARYNPVSDELELFDGVEMEVVFNGGRGAFVTSAAVSPFDGTRRMIDGTALNSDILFGFVEDHLIEPIDIGEELLILTYPEFKPAADRLAQWKNHKGIMTNVFVVNDNRGPAPDTAIEIEAFIDDRYFNSIIPPSYVLLLGDAEFIPTFYVSSPKRGMLGSDYPYSTIVDFSDTPDYLVMDMAFGRMPVDTLAQADIAVDKLIGYESSPPNDPAFYQNATMASQFQCCRTDVLWDGWAQRTFAEVSEFTRDVLMNRGYTVERIYQKTVDSEYTDLGGWPLPIYYHNGTFLPPDIGGFSGYPWDGSTQDVIDAFNQGRFFILHRDHGGSQLWSHPRFTVNHVRNLTNGELLPVVFSVNCATGLFDDETIDGASEALRFAEALIKEPDGGAVGVLADTRNSPSWPNTFLTMGFVDAVWPEAVSNFGPLKSRRRLADILNCGKFYLWHRNGFNVDTIDETTMWHAFGDPTLEIWTSAPVRVADFEISIEHSADGMEVRCNLEGALLTAYQIGEDGKPLPVGRAPVVEGRAFVEYFRDWIPGIPLYVSAELENVVSVRASDGGTDVIPR